MMTKFKKLIVLLLCLSLSLCLFAGVTASVSAEDGQRAATEVCFVLDASGSMAWCADPEHEEAHGGWGTPSGSWCGHEGMDGESDSRWVIAVSAISQIADALGDSAAIRYTYFSDENVQGRVSSPAGYLTALGGRLPSGSSYAAQGIEYAIRSGFDSRDSRKILVIVSDGDSDSKVLTAGDANAAPEKNVYSSPALEAFSAEPGNRVCTLSFAGVGNYRYKLEAVAGDPSLCFDFAEIPALAAALS